jgi:Cu-Zn family superoxide dismutase
MEWNRNSAEDMTMSKMDVRGTGALLLAAALFACNSDSRGDRAAAPGTGTSEPPESAAGESDSTANDSAEQRAEAALTAAPGAKIEGKATFIEEPGGVRVVLEVENAPPGKKGVHVHERGDCSDIPAKSMGPHFAPKLEQHALPAEGDSHHLGDLGNIVVNADGTGRLEIKAVDATLSADDGTSFLGRALVVHTGEDAGSVAQPAGDSGAPMACGVIQKPTS